LSTNASARSNELINHDIKVTYNNKFTTVSFLATNATYSFHHTFLRDAATGSLSIEPTSGQKLFTTASIIDQIPDSIEIPDNNSIQIVWPDGEKSTYTKEFLERYATDSSLGLYFNKEITHWDADHPDVSLPSLKGYDYKAYLKDDSILASVVNDLNKFGFAAISNIPEKSDEDHDTDPIVKAIAERIGYVKETFYGTVFDVRTKPNAGNIADTDKFLPLHQDLLYYESPPGLQLLHFIKNKSTGGENVFADGFAAAGYIKEIDPEAYQALLKCPVNFHYDRNGHHYFQARRLIVEGEKKASNETIFKEINYSPPFQAPFDFGVATDHNSKKNSQNADRGVFEDFLRGLKMFEDYVNAPKNRLKFKTEEGTCIVFDNRRILHAREAFDAKSGERWLKGCYLDRDAFQSKLRTVKNTAS
jgi:alpha-ketoglutarate-dependent taurine dioxygenase